MRIKTIEISAFRNLYDFHLTLSGGVNLLYGENGHGKTNLLESIALIIDGRTPRASRLQEIIPHDGTFARWKLGIDINKVHYDAECIIETGQSKKLLVNGQKAKKLPETNRGVYALTFFPEDFNILTGEPFFRRRFLDEIILLTEPGYSRTMKNYKDAYSARNAMLKNKDVQPANFVPYENILSRVGLEITRRRSRALDELQDELKRISDEVFANEISFSLSYKPSLGNFLLADDVGGDILRSYEENRYRDIVVKRTLLGPHRDDFAAMFKDEDIRRFSSRGETRLSVVMLIIAKYYMLKKRWDLNPVILLDDIFSELDRGRRQKILKALPETCQLMITAVDKDLSKNWLDDMKDIAYFQVASGIITRE